MDWSGTTYLVDWSDGGLQVSSIRPVPPSLPIGLGLFRSNMARQMLGSPDWSFKA